MEEFWLFSFERYNGILGKQSTNCGGIEIQLMSRFLKDNQVSSFSYPDEFVDEFRPVCEFNIDRRLDDSAGHIRLPELIKLPSTHSRGVLTSTEIDVLDQLYLRLTSDSESQQKFEVHSIILKYSSITINGKNFRSSRK